MASRPTSSAMRLLHRRAHSQLRLRGQAPTRGALTSNKRGNSTTAAHSPPTPSCSARPLTVLGIESSADDSCCAIVTSDRRILANDVIKQHLLNAKFGGIHPIKAQDAHTRGVPSAIASALSSAQLSIDDIDAIAYTRGPGMHSCLAVGAASAHAIAALHNKPLLGVHHMQAHALTPLLTEADPPQFPFLILLVSGGHTQLVLAQSMDQYRVVIDKTDNSIGDAYDKIARELDLPIDEHRNPGAVLEEFAARVTDADLAAYQPLPVPYRSLPNMKRPRKTKSTPHSNSNQRSGGHLVHSTDLLFSFAGLMSATIRLRDALRPNTPPRRGAITDEQKAHVARLFQNAAVEHLVLQIQRALDMPIPPSKRVASKEGTLTAGGQATRTRGDESGLGVVGMGKRRMGDQVQSLVVSGGVASNLFLRERLRAALQGDENTPGIRMHYPPISLCTDNAAMIAWTAILRLQRGATGEPFGLPIRPKWSLEALYDDLDSRPHEDEDEGER